jgi:DNA gyrase subunit A
MATKEEDVVWRLFVASTHATMLFFTSTGRVFARKVHQLPDVGPTARGRALVNLLPVERDETVAALLAVRDFKDHEDSYLLFASRLGRVKRTPLADYANIRSTGIRAVAINDGDDLLSVHLTHNSKHVFMGTHHGMGICFREQDVRSMGRVSAGVRGINLRPGDWVEEVATFDPANAGDILVVTDLGFGKRTSISEFRVQQRGGYGITVVRLTDKNGSVAGIRHVHEDDQALMVTEQGMLIRMNVAEISRIGRATQGVRLIRLDEGDRVVAVVKLVEQDDDGNGSDDPSENT